MNGLEILAYEETPLGVLCLRRRELLKKPGVIVTEVTLNHEFLMSSYLTESERALSSCGLSRLSSRSSKTSSEASSKYRVLVGGLGLGYTAAEALKSDQVDELEVVEFLPEVIGWMADGKVPLSESLNADSRIKITHGDIYGRLAQPPGRLFDLVVIDVDHSPEDVLGGQSKGFYSQSGLQKAVRHLVPGGVLGVWSYAADTPLLENMRAAFDDVDVEQVTVWNDLVDVEQTDWLFFGRRPV